MKFIKDYDEFTVFNLNFTEKFNLVKNLTTSFIAINPLSFINFLEGKNFILSKAFFKFRTPFIILGNSISQIFDSTYINQFLKKFMNSAIILQIKEACNSSGLEHFPIIPFNLKDIKTACGIFSVNLDNDLILFKDIFNLNIKENLFFDKNYIRSFENNFFNLNHEFNSNYKYKIYGKNSKFPSDILSLSCYKEKYWANVYNSNLAKLHSSLTLSLLPFYKQKSIYINLEYRPQKTKTLLDLKFDYNISDTFCFFFYYFINKLIYKKSFFFEKHGILNNNSFKVIETAIYNHKSQFINFFDKSKKINSQFIRLPEVIKSYMYNYQTIYISLEYLADNKKEFSTFKNIYLNSKKFYLNKIFNFSLRSLEPISKKTWNNDQNYIKNNTLNLTKFDVFLKK
jgi:hypothetical protein